MRDYILKVLEKNSTSLLVTCFTYSGVSYNAMCVAPSTKNNSFSQFAISYAVSLNPLVSASASCNLKSGCDNNLST